MGGGVQIPYEEESYELEVNKENKVSTTMFTYSENSNFSGFWFYNDNDNSNYSVTDKGEIISSNNLKNFNLESGTFVRRIGLNEGEIGETQSEKSEKRIVYISKIIETTITIDTTTSTLYYDSDTLIITKGDNNPEWVGNYYVEFTDSKNTKIQLIIEINKDDKTGSIIKQIGSTAIYNINGVEFNNPGVNFNIMIGSSSKIIYTYGSRDIKDEEFMNKKILGILSGNATMLLVVHLAPGVKKIGNSAFQNCKDLIQVTIPNNVKTIGTNAFDNCKSLAKIIIIGLPTNIGENAFDTNSTLTIYCNETTKRVIAEAIKDTDYKDNISFASLEQLN